MADHYGNHKCHIDENVPIAFICSVDGRIVLRVYSGKYDLVVTLNNHSIVQGNKVFESLLSHLSFQRPAYTFLILTRSGNMGIYEETFEKISYRVRKAEEKKNKTLIPEGTDDDDALVSFLFKL